MLVEEQLTEQIIGAAIGKFASGTRAWPAGICVRAVFLPRTAPARTVPFRCQIDLPVTYKGLKLDCGYRVDVVVEDSVVVELKSVEQVLPIHQAQLLTYLRLSGKRVGLALIQFSVCRIIEEWNYQTRCYNRARHGDTEARRKCCSMILERQIAVRPRCL